MADCNFHFVNSLAYTEDSVLVYNLFIYRISRKVTEDDCRQYLARFGEIVRFRFIVTPAHGHRRVSRHAFVNFKTAETAATVLKRQFHSISYGKVFSIKACDSWHQPKFSSAQNALTGNLNNNVNPNKTSNVSLQSARGKNKAAENASPDEENFTLLDLHEDCLFVILKYLPLHDQVSLARSHYTIEEIFKTYAKLYYKNISTEHFHSMSLWNIRQLFVLAGEFFEKITFVEWFQNKNCERIANFVQYNCPNLKKIKLDTAKIRVQNLYKILNNKMHLTQINLNCLSINDNCINAMKKTPTLEQLSISHCYNFTGRFLYLLPGLKALRLANCSSLESSNLHKAICVMTKLVALDVTGAGRLTKSVFDSMPIKNKDLEILQMSCGHASYDRIANLPKLRCLSLYCENPFTIRSTAFNLLVEKCSEQLESLQIVSRQMLTTEQCQLIAKLKRLKKLHVPCNSGINDHSLWAFSELKNLTEIKLNGSQNLTNNGLLELVRNCPKLKWVNVQHTPIDNNFAKKLLPIIKKEKRENGCITFLVKGTQMNQHFDMPQEYETEELKSLVQFVFEQKHSLKSYDNLYDDFENDYNGTDEVPFFESENLVSDSDDQDDDDDDDDDSIDLYGLDEVDFLLNIPILQHFAIREALGVRFDYRQDSDDSDDEDVYLW